MNQSDLTPFAESLADMLAVLSHGRHAPDAGAVRVWFRTLQPYTLAQVLGGMDAHMRSPSTGRTLPIPSDIVAQIVGAATKDGRPDGDEAWAIALQARSEAATVVWTDEMAQAWSIARTVMDVGDDVGARMAFREAYARLVAEARRQGTPASWQASLGFDEPSRAAAIVAAVEAGRLPRVDLLALPAPCDDRSGGIAPAVLAKLQAIGSEIRNRPEPPSVDQAERERTRALQAEADRLAKDPRFAAWEAGQ
jgi:hypothetical protein